MKRLLTPLRAFFALRALTPLVMLGFLLLYIGIAFFNDEPLTTLLSLTRAMIPVSLLLAVIPLNCAVRLLVEAARFGKRRKLMQGGDAGSSLPELFDEAVTLPGNGNLAALQESLESFGYRTRLTGSALAAWRGISLSPARTLFLVAMFCLFTGILLSTTMRSSQRVAVIEGESFPLTPEGDNRVERITLHDKAGLILERALSVEVAGKDGRSRMFGLYPPALYHGNFVYPRYLGIAPLVHFSAPDFQTGFETHYILMIYPPGKEDSADIPGTGYRVVFSMAQPEAGDEPFRSRRMTLLFKVLQGDALVSSGTLPLGGEFSSAGYRLSFADFRRVVATDLVRDYGVIPIWAAALVFVAALLFWLPVRLFYPRREMLFFAGADVINACSRAEGRRGQHGGIFHEALDLLAADRL